MIRERYTCFFFATEAQAPNEKPSSDDAMIRLACLAVFLIAFPSPACVWSQILPPDSSVERLARGFSFTEGPVDDGNGGILFTDLGRTDIIRYDIASMTTETVDRNSGGANGLFFDLDHNLISMDGNQQQVSRRDKNDVSVVAEVLADNWNGTAFNSPNDLVIDRHSGIYFTDPDYQNRRSQAEAVYYLSPDGELSQLLTGFRRPNGIALSPDEDTLYLAVEGELRIMAYDVGPAGMLSNEREFALTNVDENGERIRGISNGPDGMTVDPAGNLYAAVQNEVWAWAPNGDRLFELRVPENPTNVEFGGTDGKTLFITAQSSLYSIQLNIVPEPTYSTLLVWGALPLLSYYRRRTKPASS